MDTTRLAIDLAAILAGGAPLVIAALGETISERAGVVNLSLDGKMLLAGMTGFAVGLHTGDVLLGFAAAALVGALVAAVVCLVSLRLRQSQTAVGFGWPCSAPICRRFWGTRTIVCRAWR
jgi:simple sugar transport system permease protein